MSPNRFLNTEFAAALARGVRQCVIVGSRPALGEAFENPTEQELRVFAVDEDGPPDSPASFVPAQFDSETLATALERSGFDRRKASLFVWLGGAKYRTVEAAMSSLAFIASLPKGSGVLLDYAVERTSVTSLADTALDTLATRVCGAGGRIKHLIQPEAVAAMLSGFGFQKIVDQALEELPIGGHLVSAVL